MPKIIVDIDDDFYHQTLKHKRLCFEYIGTKELVDAIANGIPLQKFANELIESIEHIGGNEKNALRLNLNPSYATGLERAVAKIKEFFTNVEVSE